MLNGFLLRNLTFHCGAIYCACCGSCLIMAELQMSSFSFSSFRKQILLGALGVAKT